MCQLFLLSFILNHLMMMVSVIIIAVIAIDCYNKLCSLFAFLIIFIDSHRLLNFRDFSPKL